MRIWWLLLTSPLLIGLLLTLSCRRLEIYTPDVLVRPAVVGHGAHFSVRMYGAEVADYRFMGAVKQQDGSWEVRLDLVWLGMINQESRVTIRQGDILPLGPSPSVNVEFRSVSPTELEVRAVGVHNPRERY